MWSLPELKPQDVEQIDGFLREYSIWGILLFPRADRTIIRALEKNWKLFSQSLGAQAHVITLLEQSESTTGTKLAFPHNYESLVGDFCNVLGIPVNDLPVMVLLNGVEEPAKAPPYWSFAGDPENGSKMLMSLVGDFQYASFNVPRNVPADKWRKSATNLLFQRAIGRSAKRIATLHTGKLIAAVKSAILNAKFLRPI